MKALISGASGFIGSHLQAELMSRGVKVKELLRDELYSQEKLKKIADDFLPDYIFHLAAYGNKYDQRDDWKIINANIMTTLNLLYATKDIPYSAFINTGSSSEYGTKTKAMKETDSLDTDTFYGATKASSTMLCRAFANKYHKPVVTARPFSVYGDGDDPNHFIPTVIKAFREDLELKLSSGVHDWIHINDYIEGVMVIAKNAYVLEGRAVNIGTGIQTSNHAIVSMVRDALSVRGNIKYVGKLREYDTNQVWVADNSLLKALGWKTEHDLEHELERMAFLYGYI